MVVYRETGLLASQMTGLEKPEGRKKANSQIIGETNLKRKGDGFCRCSCKPLIGKEERHRGTKRIWGKNRGGKKKSGRNEVI